MSFRQGRCSALLRNMIGTINRGQLNMQYLQVSARAANIDETIRFYTNVFGRPPTNLSANRVWWSFDDPEVRFTISIQRDAVQSNAFS